MNLSAWLERIQSLHPKEIELGLGRVREVAHRLGLTRPAPCVITVAGTNGKGSTVAMLAAIAHAAGYRVGTYTSPHILRFNERITIRQQEASDQALCDAFARIDAVRGEISLSYFEFSTLAGLMLLEQAGLEIAVLEVGLGGRLDAVNIVDPDLSIITSIGLDHQDWLGNTREAIAVEKGGILRRGVPALCGDAEPPLTLLELAQQKGTVLQIQERDYGYVQTGETWEWWYRPQPGQELLMEDLPVPGLDLVNAATVLTALQHLALLVPRAALEEGLLHPNIQGRFQRLSSPREGVSVRVDVAHNGHAGAMLAQKLRRARSSGEIRGQVRVVLAMMSDKDHAAFHAALETEVDFWYIAAFAEPRCLAAETLYAILRERGARVCGPFESVEQAYRQACQDADAGDLILATGSFVTVADVMQASRQAG
ncbi:MAG: bifunctional tetrahydrofolate synthase/dihydrofolate synthase [Pseudomonadales bacterium]|nr:bifunctional tetrahydrofolate synthase/dihydrofolate synthase [Pseudomonadales bacterium]MCP5357427.1 bifunctional tetrahydrofolate synthase/dihydrofolate synthase [Pseudomonadales bacterium]